jgi:prepilin-type N-terminal cleavage/methylation domain-containing protein
MSARPSVTKFFSMRVLLTLSKFASSRSAKHPTEQGLSLIECLLAIVIIALTATAVTPPILLATGTRIQSRRAEQANQIAQAEVDRIRSIVERGTYTITDLPMSTGQKTGIASFGPPSSIGTTLLTTSSTTCPGSRYPLTKPGSATELVKVDIDGDCTPEYLMQVFRTEGCVPNTGDPNQPYSFYVGVRIYAYKDGETVGQFDTQRATLNLSSTGRKDQVNNTRKPLQTLYTKIARNNSQLSYECVAQ